jgi:hypothetical protein
VPHKIREVAVTTEKLITPVGKLTDYRRHNPSAPNKRSQDCGRSPLAQANSVTGLAGTITVVEAPGG